jgi:hypothetical protein
VAGLGPAVSHATLKVPRGATAIRYYARPGLTAALIRYHGKLVLLAELQGDQMGLFKKFVGPGTNVEPVQLGEFGLLIRGGPHVLMWQFNYGEVHHVETRLAGNVLLWLRNGTTYRLEGDLDKGQMLALARQITR